MYHSIAIGNKNTYDDWHLIPSSRPVILPPPIKTNYIDIPGRDGKLDYSEALLGRPTYENRTGSLEFIVENGYRDWAGLYTEIMQNLHGKRKNICLEDDPGYYYTGRLAVSDWESASDGTWSTITIDYELEPFKYDIGFAVYNWLWNPFNFDTGIIPASNLSNMTVASGDTLDIIGGDNWDYPEITLTSLSSNPSSLAFTFRGHNQDGSTVTITDTLSKGIAYKNRKIRLGPDLNQFTFSGAGQVRFYYRRGIL